MNINKFYKLIKSLFLLVVTVVIILFVILQLLFIF